MQKLIDFTLRLFHNGIKNAGKNVSTGYIKSTAYPDAKTDETERHIEEVVNNNYYYAHKLYL